MSALFRAPLIVIDTETTGLLNDAQATPWEIAAVLLDEQGQEVSTLGLIGRPDPWREDMRRIVALGGIDPDAVLAMAPIAERRQELQGWLDAGLAGGARITSFNVEFDATMLDRGRLVVAPKHWGPCIMSRAKKVMGPAGALPWYRWLGDWKMPRLSEAASFYGVPQQHPAHRALADARTAGLIACELQRRALAAREAQ